MFGALAKSDNLICVQPKPAWLESERSLRCGVKSLFKFWSQFCRRVSPPTEGKHRTRMQLSCGIPARYYTWSGVWDIPCFGIRFCQSQQNRVQSVFLPDVIHAAGAIRWINSVRLFDGNILDYRGGVLENPLVKKQLLLNYSWKLILSVSWIFFTINLLITLCFTLLARQWAQLMIQWENTEQSLPRRTQLSASNRRLLRKVKVFTSILMLSAMFEHALAKPSGLYRAYRCGIKELLKAHLMQAFPEMFSFIQYNVYIGFVAQVVTTILTFYWNFIDLFLIILSIGLRNNLKHVNDVILDSKAYYHSELFWHDHWKHYQRVCELVHLFKGKMAVFVIISFANNLFFICIQLVGFLK